MTTLPSAVCFLDVNTLIHFETFDEVDWPQIIGAGTVTLVLAPTVLRELDKLKVDQTNDRRQTRVRTLLSKISGLLSNAPIEQPVKVREGVAIIDLPNEPLIDWAGLGLDKSIEDDRLLASLIEYKQRHTELIVLLFTNDFGLRRKCSRHHIENRDPEGVLKSHIMHSPEKAKLEQLENKVRSLESRLPKLDIGYLDDGKPVSFIRVGPFANRETWRTDEEIADEVDQERRSCLRLLAPDVRSQMEIECKKYESEVNWYIEVLELFLSNRRIVRAGCRVELQVQIVNSGSAPASDIEANLYFPKGSRVCLPRDLHRLEMHDDDNERPKRPSVPRIRESKGGSVTDLMAALETSRIELTSPVLPAHLGSELEMFVPKLSSHEIPDRTEAGGNVLYLTPPKLRAKESWKSDRVIASLPPTHFGGIEISYWMHTDEFIEPMNGSLHIVMR